MLLSAALGIGATMFVVTNEVPVEDPVWWYSNETPPRLTVQGPSGPLRGTASATLAIEPGDRTHLESATLDGQPLIVERSNGRAQIVVDSSTLRDGPHTVVVNVRDTSRHQNRASTSWTFSSDNTGPELDVRLDPAAGPAEGRAFVLKVLPSEPVRELIGQTAQGPVSFFPDGEGGFWTLQGITPQPASLEFGLTLRAADTLGNETPWQRTWAVRKTAFEEELLEVEPTMDALTESTLRSEEAASLAPYYRPVSGLPQWEGRFLLPVQGPVTTEFGTLRSYLRRPDRNAHGGTDFAAPLGAPVRSSARGTVVFTRSTPVHGNLVIVDHGAGVFSSYAHLQRFDAAEGQSIAAGDVVGRVGSTGLSTGPHLHWEVWVNGANVDPMEWTRRTFP